jgi:CMP-N-acetylneuraminic acid synthetase
MLTVAVILARAGSKGLPDKCVLPLCGRPIIAYTIDHEIGRASCRERV